MNSVIRLTAMPPTDGIAIGCITSDPRPVAQKMGMSPKTVVAIVIRHGRMRLRPASMTAVRISPMDANARRACFEDWRARRREAGDGQ